MLPAGLRIGSVVSIALYAVFAVLILQAAGASAPAAGRLRRGGDLGADRLLRPRASRMNAISRSRPERLVMTPVVALLAVACLVLALG